MDDTAIVACIRGEQDSEYREMVRAFSEWNVSNHLLPNTSKTKEMVIDLLRSESSLLRPVNIEGVDTEGVKTYSYLGVHLDDTLDWAANADALYKKGQSRLHFLRRLTSFNVSRDMLYMFYKSVVESALLFAAVCWGGGLMDKNRKRLDKLIKEAVLVLGRSLDSVGTVVERRSLSKMQSILDNSSHPLHCILAGQKSSRSERLILVRYRTERVTHILDTSHSAGP